MPDTSNTQHNKLQNLLLVTNEAANSSATNITDAIRPLVQRYGYDLGSKNFDYCKLRAENDDITLYECTNKDITTLVIHPSVTNIESAVFSNTYYLQTVVFPQNSALKHLGKAAFMDCYWLTSINLPDTLKIIEESTFEDTNLKYIAIPDSVTAIGKNAFAHSNIETIIIGANVNEIGDYAFANCSSIKETYINNLNKWYTVNLNNGYANVPFNRDGVVYVRKDNGEYELLKILDIPTTVTSISAHLFASCGSLETLNIPASVTSLGNYSFRNCKKLSTVNFPNTLSTIGQGTFQGCKELHNITLPSTLTSIEAYAFENCDITEVQIPASVTKIGSGVFAGCNNLTNITVAAANAKYSSENNCLIETYQSQFYNSKTLLAAGKNCIISNDITIIGNSAFSGREWLTTFNAPESLKTISDYAFDNCVNLKSITLPATLSYIGFYAFNNCKNLVSINFTGTKEQWMAISKSVHWHNNDNLVINCTDGMIDLTGTIVPALTITADNRSNIGYTGVENEELVIPEVVIIDGITYQVNSIGQYAFSDCNGLSSVTLPSTAAIIEAFAFNNCANLASITMPDTLSAIQEGAFKDCTSLTGIKTPNSDWGAYLPNNLTTIGADAFYGCSSFKHVILPASVTSIGDGAFAYCTSLIGISVDSNNPYFISYKDPDDGDVPDKYLVEIATSRLIYSIGRRIPEGIKIIDKYSCTPVEYGRIYLPTSVKEIRDYAFSCNTLYCVNNYTGYTESMTIYQWNKITKTANWHKAAYRNMFIVCKDGFTTYINGIIDELWSGYYYLNGNITLKSTLNLPNTTNTLNRKFSVTLDGTTIKFDSITVTRIGVTYNNSNGSTTVYNSTYGWTNDAYRNIYIDANTDYGDTLNAEYVLASSMTEWLDSNSV
jgi:hypothetical protein